MGLDSVELIMSIEDYFSINIEDLEAEQIHTVQDFVNCAAKHLHITNHDDNLKEQLFEKLKAILTQNQSLVDFSLSSPIFNFLDLQDPYQWEHLSTKLGLRIQKPVLHQKIIFGKTIRKILKAPYEWDRLTVDQFITAIYAYNYEKVIDPKNLQSSYEILIAITGITSDRLGVDIYAIHPHSSFVNDFGVD